MKSSCLATLFLLASFSARAADREFTDVVHVISDEFHTRPISIPMFGLVNIVTAAIHPAGTRHIDLAVFEHLGSHDREGRNMSEAILNAVGRSWKPFVVSFRQRCVTQDNPRC
jgi:hypothetical protein